MTVVRILASDTFELAEIRARAALALDMPTDLYAVVVIDRHGLHSVCESAWTPDRASADADAIRLGGVVVTAGASGPRGMI